MLKLDTFRAASKAVRTMKASWKTLRMGLPARGKEPPVILTLGVDRARINLRGM
jgi:hypothetical protein